MSTYIHITDPRPPRDQCNIHLPTLSPILSPLNWHVGYLGVCYESMFHHKYLESHLTSLASISSSDSELVGLGKILNIFVSVLELLELLVTLGSL